jgi:hypothetical protein
MEMSQSHDFAGESQQKVLNQLGNGRVAANAPVL